MKFLKYAWVNLLETCLRAFPFPCKTGLVKLGNPDENSPVFLTGNFQLTVERVKRSIRKLDCYLLIANSRGINVWCGSAGGHLTNHSVISVLKTSGIENLVKHRKIILPQLAATGIETKEITHKTGWHITWGPVYSKDIPAFMENQLVKTEIMHQVRFLFSQRLEMAVMWAFPFSLIAALLTIFIWIEFLWEIVGLIWILALLIFMLFPFYVGWLKPRKKRFSFSKYTVVFDLARTQFILWGIIVSGILVIYLVTQNFTFGNFIHWSFLSFVIILLLSLDLFGSTPVVKSGLHEDRFFDVKLNESKCKGTGFCQDVCPKNCLDVDRVLHKTTISRPDDCVQCGACIVQCPFDALHFQNPQGDIITPNTIRKFKLNLLGSRVVKNANNK